MFSPKWRATSISLAYVAVALVWILGSDAAVTYLAPPGSAASLQLGKGVGFVIVTALVLRLLLGRIESCYAESEQLRNSQMQTQRMRDLYAALSAANHAMMEVEDRYNLFTRICQIIVDSTGLRMAWIGLVEPSDHWVVPVAWDGDELGKWYLKQIKVSSDPAIKEGRGPVGRAIVNQQTTLFRNFLEDPDAAPWHTIAREVNFTAVAAFPLRYSGSLAGALAVYASDDSYFTDEVIGLIEDLVAYIGFAVDSMERETERRRQNEKIQYLAEHDLTTGLLNRNAMAERIDNMLEHCRGETGSLVGVLFVNLDRFRVINDAFGHHAGDKLLYEAAARLHEVVGREAEVSRQGADEFLILVPQPALERTLEELAERILVAFSTRPLRFLGFEHTISPSIGAAIFPQDAVDVAALISNAEIAMQAAKRGGRGRYHRFTTDMQSFVQERLELEANLRGALESGGLELWYQPQINISDMRLVGVEALMRWYHPERGWISPAEFIPVAEESGLIIELGNWAIGEACKQCAEWHYEGVMTGPVAVNASAVQLSHRGLAETIDKYLNFYGLSPRMLQLEVTESLFIHENTALQETLESLQHNGLRLAVDDFGTGYSNLGYLKRLPLAKLKIDKSFVLGLPDDVEDGVITRTIVNMAVGLNLRVIAEGVETRQHLAYLQDIGCHEAQGFLFGRPQSAAELTERMRSGASWLLE